MYCVGGRHRSATTNIHGDIRFKGSKILNDHCSICDRKESKIVSENKTLAEGFSDFSKNLGIKGLDVSKKMAKNVLANPGRVLEVGANVGTAFASRSPIAALSSLPEVIAFCHTGKGLNIGKLVSNFEVSVFSYNESVKKTLGVFSYPRNDYTHKKGISFCTIRKK